MEMAIDEELDHFAEACMVMLPELPTVSVSMEVDAATADLSIGDQQQQQDGEEFVAFCDCEKLIGGGGGLEPIDGSPPRLLHHDDHGPMTHNRALPRGIVEPRPEEDLHEHEHEHDLDDYDLLFLAAMEEAGVEVCDDDVRSDDQQQQDGEEKFFAIWEEMFSNYDAAEVPDDEPSLELTLCTPAPKR